MGENKFKEGIKPYVKDKVFKWSSVIVLTVLVIFLPLLYFTGILLIEERMLFWLFAATSQSMAALFAVVGMFAVFRYQDIQTKLRREIDVLKAKFKTEDWIRFFGSTDPDSWEDSIIVAKGKEKLDEKKDESPHVIYNNLDVSIEIIKSIESVRNHIRVYARIPMILILMTFMMSIFSLPIVCFLSNSGLGLGILMVVLVFVTLSMISIFKYFMISVPPR